LGNLQTLVHQASFKPKKVLKSNLTTLEEIPKVENSYHRPLDGGIKEQKTQPLFTLSVTNLSFLCS